MDADFKVALEQAVSQGDVLENEPMNLHTTFRVGGPADFFVVPATVDEVKAVCALCRARGVSLYVTGCGSNVLVSDEGVRGVVMKIGSKLAAIDVQPDGTVHAESGATNAKIARAACEAGFGGFEFAAGIPGSIGGAAIMNAGAYDGELRHVATGVTCLSQDGEVRYVDAQDTGWGYRRSNMGERGDIILSVDLKLTPKDPELIKGRMAELAKRRSDKQPLDIPSAGSTFKRPEGHFAGKLIQDAGMQGYTVGGAQVSTKHAGFVVNIGDATASDVKQVIDDVRVRVSEEFGVMLEPEVKMWGF